jgi:hypothetical protein
MPERLGTWKGVHRRFGRRATSGVWERVFAALSADAHSGDALIDATIIAPRIEFARSPIRP